MDAVLAECAEDSVDSSSFEEEDDSSACEKATDAILTIEE